MEYLMTRFLAPTIIAAATTLTIAQSFPIVPASDPIYPADIPELALFDWDSDLGVLTRSADLNNDGIEDLVVLFNGPGNLNIPVTKMLWLYPRNADGSFGAPEYISGFAFEGANEVQDFIIHDQNADGLNDLVFVLDEGTIIATWLSTGDAYSQAPTLNLPITPTPGEYGRIIAKDLDQDGHDDYIVWSSVMNIDAWVNQTDGSFTHQHIASFNAYAETKLDVTVTDFSDDGDLDILVIEGGNLILIEHDLGIFSPPNNLFFIETKSFPLIGSPKTFADANGDGSDDIVAFGELNEGQAGIGVFLAPFSFNPAEPTPFTPFPERLDETDAGGIIELIISSNSWANSIQSAGDLDGDGTDEITLFTTPEKRNGWRITDPMNNNHRFGIAEAYTALGAGDFDKDNHNYLYTHTLNYQDTFFDINNDGVKDKTSPTPVHKHIRRNQEDPTVMGVMLTAVLSNPFDPTYLDDPRDNINGPSNMTHIMHTDLNGDGITELVVTHQSDISIISQDQDGYLAYDSNTRFSGHDGFRTIEASLDQNSTPDLVSWSIGSQDRFPAIHLNPELSNRVDNTINTSLPIDFNAMLSAQNITYRQDGSSFFIDDIDADGDNDLVLSGHLDEVDGFFGDALLVWLNDSNANFTIGPISPITSYDGTITQFIKPIDHDNDGDSDIACIAGNSINQTIELYNNDGSGNYTLHSTTLISDDNRMSPFWIDVQDIDNDGYDDVLVLLRRRFGDSEIVILYGSPNGLATTPIYLTGDGAAGHGQCSKFQCGNVA